MLALQVERITKRYGDFTAVDGVDFQVKAGEIFGLLGANGAGKTTTMRMVLGLIHPDEGKVVYQGKAYSEQLQSLLGYLPEERGLYPKISVSEQVIYFAQLRGVSRKQAARDLRQWLDKFGVPEYYDKKVEELSKGNQQKIQFIASVIHNPEIVILDEAFSGLDPVNVELLKETVKDLKQQGKTMLFSSHRMDHVEELCENICILHRSKMVLQGNLRDIRRSFPRERIVLETVGEVKGLEALPGVKTIHRNQAGYTLQVDGHVSPQQLLRHAMSQAEIVRFQIMEPTLNEIFIRTVGQSAAGRDVQ